ncbi:MAG: FG-GAP repeat protein [Polyangiales bacterium]
MNRTLVSCLIACALAFCGCTALTDFEGVAADGATGDGAVGDGAVDADAAVDGGVDRDSGSDAGDAGNVVDAGEDTSVPVDAGPAILCDRDENVLANTCTPCAFGTFTARNDPAAGPDTECDAECANLPCDACDLSLGVPCEVFEDAYVKASNTGAADNFGAAIAISGNTMVVGAPLEDSDATGVSSSGEGNNARIDSGAAYVYVRVGGVWMEQAYLKADNAGAGDEFGRSVAIDGDRIVVGAPFEDSNATNVNNDGSNDLLEDHGAAYVFERTGETWEQVAYLKGPNSTVRVAGNGVSMFGDEWGSSVAVSGSLVAVGGPKEDSVGNNPTNNDLDNGGAVALFERGGDGGWSRLLSLKAPNVRSGDFFGTSIALDGTTLVVGADGEDNTRAGVQHPPRFGVIVENEVFGRAVGAAYVFVFDGSSWVLQAYLKPSTVLSGALGVDTSFGRTVAVDGNRVVVGATGESSPASGVNGEEEFDSGTRLGGAGAAYVFDRTGRLWTQVAYLKASSPDAGDAFGSDVAVSGDVVAVGAFGEDGSSPGVGSGVDADNGASLSGAAYIFRRVDDVWRYLAYVKAAFPDAEDFAGEVVALDGNTLAIGAPNEESSAIGVDGDPDNNDTQDSGAVYVRRLERE